MHYYRFNVGDYIRDCSHLSLIEDIVYRRLLDIYYVDEGLHGDAATLARRIRAADQVQVVEQVLSEFFELVDGCWKNSRCDKEIAAYHGQVDGGSKGGRASAKARAEGGSTQGQGKGQPTNNQDPRTKNQEDPPTPQAGGDDEDEDKGAGESAQGAGDFDRFWAAYPRKVARAAAAKAFERIKPDASTLAWMLGAIEAQSKRGGPLEDREGGKFIPHAATWLNQRRWEETPRGNVVALGESWYVKAGFPNWWEAENAWCYPRNAHLWRDGKPMPGYKLSHGTWGDVVKFDDEVGA